MTTGTDIPALLDELQALYSASAARLRSALTAYLRCGERPDPDARMNGAFAYPELRVTYAPQGAGPRLSRAYAQIGRAHV